MTAIDLDEKPFRWTVVKDKDEIEAFYRSVIPEMREAARVCGYAIGVHGSLRRDLDLIAVPWREDHASKDELARHLHRAACGIERQTYVWEQKPLGRVAVSFPVCFPEWNEPNLGHVDLSVAEFAGAEIERLRGALKFYAGNWARIELHMDAGMQAREALKGGKNE